ncbi:MAG: hypothetical protein WAQ98_32435 [Blastocatellia bacterium]
MYKGEKEDDIFESLDNLCWRCNGGKTVRYHDCGTCNGTGYLLSDNGVKLLKFLARHHERFLELIEPKKLVELAKALENIQKK